jgi:hypothetical protein
LPLAAAFGQLKGKRRKAMKYRLVAFSVLTGLVSLASYAQAPVPFINQPLVPDATAPSGAAFTLTVNGTGFVAGSVVDWNGSALATTFVNSSQLTAAVSAADIATASTALVTVVNPAPGGGTSNVVYFTITANTGNSVAFSLASSPATGSKPVSVAAGDFNGDGKLDLAVVNSCGDVVGCGSPALVPGTVSILLGDGTGNFTLASSPATGGLSPTWVAVGDFNGDGKLDLAVSNSGSATVSILLGDGKGDFSLASSPSTGPGGPGSVAVGDFNRDGNLDLAIAVANTTVSGLSILLGDGKGNFTPVPSQTRTSPGTIAVGDFNADGKLDLAETNLCGNSNCPAPGSVSILLGNGTGSFTSASSPSTGSLEPISVAVGDFNGDGKLDLAVSNFGNGFGNTLSVLLGDGAGNFTLSSFPVTGTGPLSVATGDLNGDGKLDLVSANNRDDTASVLLGDGKGNFTLASSQTTGTEPYSIAVGDFNGDGRLDLATANAGSNTLSILVQFPPGVTLMPASLSFGHQKVGTSSAPQIVTLANGTSGSVTITGIRITGVNSGDYSQTNNCGTSLGAGKSCTISMTFTPTAAGTRTATLQVTDSGPSSIQTSSLTGIGGTQPAVTLSPGSLTFPEQSINSSSSPLSVTLTNSGNQTLSIASIVASGPFSQTNTCGSSLGAGLSCTINVVFQPTSEGPFTGSITITDNAPGSPQVIGLSGQAFGTPRISATIAGQSQSGTTLTATLQITNDGTGAADQVRINQIGLRTLSGTGTVTLTGPLLPVSAGNLSIGASTAVTLTLNVPATVKKFSLTEKGSLQNIAGSTFGFAGSEVIYP